ncbi:MAG: hypothetical protein Q8787_02780, partial [Sweet potato little leaf phytoplasma]|nr:hypothetical protein [Sweet potato little leaf phytoplasma]
SASALLAGISVIPLLWVTSLYVAVPCAVVFGLGLGGVCTLWFKALAALVKGGQGLERWHYLLVAVGGVGAGCALVGSAAVLERWEVGVAVVLGAVAGCLGLGGVVLGVGAAVRDREEKKGWVA